MQTKFHDNDSDEVRFQKQQRLFNAATMNIHDDYVFLVFNYFRIIRYIPKDFLTEEEFIQSVTYFRNDMCW